MPNQHAVEIAVGKRYSQAAQARIPALCCPVQYQAEYLKVIPPEILERDYGCGDPSRYLRPGETVLDLGCGGGKICFIAAQVVGAGGRVIGVDMNDEMLALARKYVGPIGDRLGYHNCEFRKGRIQDLALDLDRLDRHLQAQPITDLAGWLALQHQTDQWRNAEPMIGSGTIDVIVSNCVLNLVEPQAKPRLFGELFRVLKPGGRAVISDIVSDQPIPERLQNDPELWSGCISGALTEQAFLQAFITAGFHGLEIKEWQAEPWRTVAGIEFRSLTVAAYKDTSSAAIEGERTVVYKGPFREVTDDTGAGYRRGERQVVSGQTFHRLAQSPYAEHFHFLPEM